MKSPTERTLKYLRAQGYVADVVERRVPHSFRTRDFCGFADILAFRGGEIPPASRSAGCVCVWRGETVAVQATTAADVEGQHGGHMAERATKIKAEPRAKAWLECGNRILVIGWALRAGSPGTRKLWIPNVLEIDLSGYTTQKEGAG